MPKKETSIMGQKEEKMKIILKDGSSIEAENGICILDLANLTNQYLMNKIEK